MSPTSIGTGGPGSGASGRASAGRAAAGVLGYWAVGIPVAAVLGLATDLAGNGIWWGMTAGLAATTVLMTGRVLRRLKRS